MKKWLEWKIRLIYLKLVKYKIIKEPKIDKNKGSYGSFFVWHTNGTMTAGHFWGDKSKVTKESLLNQLIELLNEFRKEENWTDEWYYTQLKQTLINNDVYDIYKKKERKLKLEKINENI